MTRRNWRQAAVVAMCGILAASAVSWATAQAKDNIPVHPKLLVHAPEGAIVLFGGKAEHLRDNWYARRSKNPPGWTALRKKILERDAGICHICKQPGADAQQDQGQHGPDGEGQRSHHDVGCRHQRIFMHPNRPSPQPKLDHNQGEPESSHGGRTRPAARRASHGCA